MSNAEIGRITPAQVPAGRTAPGRADPRAAPVPQGTPSRPREDKPLGFSAAGPLILGFLLLALLIGGFGYWSATSRLGGAVIASGQLVVDRNRQAVQHPDGGVVSDVLVREGATVAEGEVLIRLETEALASELAVVEGQLYEVLARMARFEAERDDADEIVFPELLLQADSPVATELMEGQSRLFQARLETLQGEAEQLARRKEQTASQIEGIEAQQVALDEQLALIEEELTDQQSLLDRGLAQAARVLALRREQANLAGRAGELAASKAQAEGRITELDLEILRLGVARREEAITRLRDLSFNEIELSEQRRTLTTQLDRREIRAPVAGTVFGLTVFGPGAVVRPADPVLSIVPSDRPLVIEAQIRATDIDQIALGQPVRLRFASFDQRRTPELVGTVMGISADAFTDETSRFSFYRAEIALDEGEAARLPEGSQLLPGMPVEAFLATQDRTPLEYVTKPMADYFARVFRDG
ncbi:HlyD family type I secretion periplasmic adaptor subunit [Wenxinia saemankumensis]|uniref:Membrane fusion protein (MFP) family protein n=1 Tax=Wenxinia saemankumensis TaxID=1447782 RepID=A0A1M6EVJ2_9RHOB|nr:HlyD family type I secretion periplasmic adaptor subunit [Wenxinia saemankumensis]SHI89379.1 HlyD family secretion protein [Wenxinia saemankumensis]